MTLTERREQINQLRLVEKKTLEETAQILGITPQRVWQIEQDVRFLKCEKHIKAEIEHIEKIKADLKNAKSEIAKMLYNKKIKEAVGEIEFYCSYKQLNFKKIKEKFDL